MLHNVLSPANWRRSTAIRAAFALRILAILGIRLPRSMAYGGPFVRRTKMQLALRAAGVYAVNKYSVWMPCYAALPFLRCRR